MVETKKFYDKLISSGIDLFTGVPDSLLADFCACVKENTPKEKNIIAANEGNAVGIASGYHISSGKYAVVYMQNSGLGNTVNPLLSLADEDVYRIPMLLIIGWRGEPGKKDEPQHVKQGKLTLPLLECMGIEYQVLGDNFETQLETALDYIKNNNKVYALVVQKGTFTEYSIKKEAARFSIKREQALETIISELSDDDFIVSTTGKTSREIFEIREKNNQSHSHDFLTVGSMGHTSSIALGMAIGCNNNIFCIDGDGSFIMHMGAVGINADNSPDIFKYILINNGAHESVGGQPTVAFNLNIEEILKASGFENIFSATSENEVRASIRAIKNKRKAALIIYVNQGSREDLGRPTISPEANKIDMMKEFAKEI